MKMKCVIAGAREDGHAKVVYEILSAMGIYDVVGFVDDDPSRNGRLIRDKPVLGKLDDIPHLITKFQIDGGIAAIGNNVQRRMLSDRLAGYGLELINAIHPTVHLDSDVRIGKGCYIGQGVIVVTGTVIGNAVNIHTGATIDHDNIIGDGANLSPGVHTAGRVNIGKDVFLGTGTVVIPDVVVGEGVIAGAGTVIINNIAPYMKVVGVPARNISR